MFTSSPLRRLIQPQGSCHTLHRKCRSSDSRLGCSRPASFFLTKDLSTSLQSFSEEQGNFPLVIELRTDSSDVKSVTAQTSYVKLPKEGDSDAKTATVTQQKVHRGNKDPGTLCEPLFGQLTANGVERRQSTTSAGNLADDAEGGECVICLTNPRDVAILHCRHVCLCSSCAAVTSSTWSFQCPVCRGRVAAMIGVS